MKVTHLKVECTGTSSALHIWVECYSIDDLEGLRIWLRLAKPLIEGWPQVAEALNEPAPKVVRMKKEKA
jgi:hypothetical protein